MRDGVKLFARLWKPLLPLKHSTVMLLSPYGVDGFAGTDVSIVGFNCLLVEMRGTYKSEGNYSFFRTEANDGYDVAQWLLQQDWQNGKIYYTGVSALAIAGYMLPITNVSLHAQCLIVGDSDTHSFVYQDGALSYYTVTGWLNATKHPSFIPTIIDEEPYSDAWLSSSLVKSGGNKNIHYPSIHIGAWFDLFQQGTLRGYQIYKQQNKDTKLIMQAQGHCAKPEVHFPNQEKHGNLLDCLEYFLHLDKHTPFSKYKTITLYVVGPNATESSNQGNYWITMDDWPATTPLKLYLGANNDLVTESSTQARTYEYDYDPLHPTPTIGGNNLGYKTCGPNDQRSIENNTFGEVLVFSTPVLDKQIAIVGQMKAVLFIRSNVTDTDFTVRITDVYPDGASMLVQDGVQRMRWRVNDTVPVPMVPGELYQVTVDLWSVAYIFNPGHRIRIIVTSSNYPRFSANPNNGLSLEKGSSGPFLVAHTSVLTGGSTSSYIELEQAQVAELEKHKM